MARLLTLQQSILKKYDGKILIGLELSFHDKFYDYDTVIQKVEKKKILSEIFPYRIDKKYPIKILSTEKASQIAVNMLAMFKEDDKNSVYYHIQGRWYLLANKNTRSLSLWTVNIEYTQDFSNDLEIAATCVFNLLSSSPFYYTAAMRLNTINLIEDLTGNRIEKIEPLTLDVMRGGKIYPLKIAQPYYAISSLPQGDKVFIVGTREGIYTVKYQTDLKTASLKLILTDTSFFNDDDFPFVLIGHEVPPKSRTNGGLHLKGYVYVVNDCLMRSGVSYVNKDLYTRLEQLNNIKLDVEVRNDVINFIVQMQREARRPRYLFTIIQDLLSKRDTLFYQSGGILFRQTQEYSKHSSYEWRQAFPVSTLLSMDTRLLENYHYREKKYLLNFPTQNMKKSMILFDMSDNADPDTWESYYRIYTLTKKDISDSRVIQKEPTDKVHVIYTEYIDENNYDFIDSKLMEGGFLILKIVEAELLHAMFIAYAQYNNAIILPDATLGEITPNKVKIGENVYMPSSLKKLMNRFNFEIVQNYILDKEVVLNSTEEHLTRVFSGVILRKGNVTMKQLQDPIKKEIEVKIEEEFVPIPEINIPQEPSPKSIETATPDLPMPTGLPDDSRVLPFARRPDYKPTPIVAGAALRARIQTKPVEEKPSRRVRKPISSSRCQALEPGESKIQWSLLNIPITRFGSIGDGSCLIHTILTAIDTDYPFLKKGNSTYENDLKVASRRARKERERLADNFTLDSYNSYDFNKLEQPYYSYENMKKRLKDRKTFIEHDMIDFISNQYEINVIFFTCSPDRDVYVRYKDGRKFSDYPAYDWIFILWVDSNHFELMGWTEKANTELIIDYDDPRIKKIFEL